MSAQRKKLHLRRQIGVEDGSNPSDIFEAEVAEVTAGRPGVQVGTQVKKKGLP